MDRSGAPGRRKAALASAARPGALLLALTFGLFGCRSAVEPDIRLMRFVDWLDIDIRTFTETRSGLFYKDLEVGGGELATATSLVTVEVQGWLPDGHNVQVREVLIARLGQSPRELVVGLEEAIQGMRVGGLRKAVLPPALAHGGRSVMIFEIELRDVQP